MAFAFLLGFLPFSLGRLLLCCMSCFTSGTLDITHSSTSTTSVLLIGYGLILVAALLSTALHTFQQYSRGEQLTITVYFHALTDLVCWLFSPLKMLPSIHVMLGWTGTFFKGIINLANVSLNLTLILVTCPLLFGWSLDIYTSKLFGVEIPQKLQLLIASSFASTALHWLIGCIFLLLLHSLLPSILRQVCCTIALGLAFEYVCFSCLRN